MATEQVDSIAYPSRYIITDCALMVSFSRV
jgi:hypothetical protein